MRRTTRMPDTDVWFNLNETIMAKTIKIWNSRKNCSEYLYRVRPTRFIEDNALCLKMDEAEAKRASDWLTFIGTAHEVIEVEGNH